MRNFKKYFFESLIQLTILANVFRQNSRHTNLLNESEFFSSAVLDQFYSSSYSSYSDSNQLNASGQLDLIFLNQNLNLNRNNSDLNRDTFLNNNYRSKEIDSYINEIKIAKRFSKLESISLRAPQILPNRNLFLLPASFSETNNKKEQVELTETRILLNSIELNVNNPSQRKEFEMDLELQNLIEQDIGIGFSTNHFFENKENEKLDSKYFRLKSKNFLDNELDEDQKHQDILLATKLIENQGELENFKLFVEEDTGEIIFIKSNENEINSTTNNTNLNMIGSITEFQDEKNKEEEDRNQTNNQSLTVKFNYDIYFPSESLHEKKQSEKENLSSFAAPNDQQENNRTDLNESSPSNFSNIMLNQRSLGLNDTIIDGLLQTDSYESSFNIQQELFNQQGLEQINQNFNLTNIDILNPNLIPANLTNQSMTLDDDFLKNFEDNLNRIDLININTEIFDPSKEEKSNLDTNEPVSRLNSTNLFDGSNLIFNNNDSFLLNGQFNMSSYFEIFNSNENSQNNSLKNLTNKSNEVIDKTVETNQMETEKEIIDAIEIKNESIELNDQDVLNLNLAQQSVPSSIFSVSFNQDMQEIEAQALPGYLHNHTYLNGASNDDDSSFHPYSYKNKLKKMLSNMKAENSLNNHHRQQETRDQMLLKENNIEFSLSEIIESNSDEFNQILKSSSLNFEQLSIIKDIRRRGKNKVAAQICRKRKIDSIDSLKEDVEKLKEIKSLLEQENNEIHQEINDLTLQFDSLYSDLTGENVDLNDPVVVYMNNLKNQLENQISLVSKSNSKSQSLFNSEESESNSSYSQNDFDSTDENSQGYQSSSIANEHLSDMSYQKSIINKKLAEPKAKKQFNLKKLKNF